MKKILILFLVLAFPIKVLAAPTNSMDISPAAVDGGTIEAFDENSRNNEVSSKFNAHSHEDLTKTTSNTWTVGDSQASDKDIIADNGDTNKARLRWDESDSLWKINNDGTNYRTPGLLETVQTYTGNKTFSGTNTHSGSDDFTGTLKIDGTTVTPSATEINTLDGVAVTLTASELNILDGVTANATEINVLDNIPATLTSTELGYVDGVTSAIQTQLNTIYTNASQYFEPDETCIVAFSAANLVATDDSKLANTVALTSLAEADLVDGIVSPKCYDYKGTETDYATIATNALQAGMSALTLEAWVNRDTAGNDDAILMNVTDRYIHLKMSDTQLIGGIVTGIGTEDWTVSHGLSSNGINQEVYIVIAWDNTGVAEIYVNGVDIGDGDDDGNGTVSDSANGINIGASEINALPFHGKIDGVRLLRRKMGAAEVLARYNAFK